MTHDLGMVLSLSLDVFTQHRVYTSWLTFAPLVTMYLYNIALLTDCVCF